MRTAAAVLIIAGTVLMSACRLGDQSSQSPLPPPYPSSTPNFSSVPAPTSVTQPGKVADQYTSPQAATPVGPRS